MKCKNAKTLGKPCANGLSMSIVCSKNLGNCIRACSVRCKGFEQDIEFSRRIQGNRNLSPNQVSDGTIRSVAFVKATSDPAVSTNKPCCGRSSLPEQTQKPQ
jgi:hypothetical protein